MSKCIFETYYEMLEKVEADCVSVWKQCHEVKHKKKMRVRKDRNKPAFGCYMCNSRRQTAGTDIISVYL